MSVNSLGDVVLASLFAFGLMAVIALATAGFISALVAGLAAFGRRSADAAAAAAAMAPEPAPAQPVAEGIDPTVVAVIAAAIQTVAGAHRIVWIGEAQTMGGWTGEVRQIHHGSHHPHHDH